MTPFLVVQTALSSLSTNKLRAGLTLLGIIIGVAAVITSIAIGRGSQEQVSDQIEALGTNLLFVQSSQGGDSTLTLSDASALANRELLPSVREVAPDIRSGGSIEAGTDVTFAQITGVTSNYAEVRNFDLLSGAFISPAHVINNEEVVVLGSSVAEVLFGNRDPVGAEVRVAGRRFRVIGVLESKGGNAFGIEDLQVMVPITTAYYRLSAQRTALGEVTVTSINVQVADVDRSEQAADEITSTLYLRHGEEDFTITNQEDAIETLQATESTFVVLLAAIAGISLFVGGIGIMNIMMVSVTERTREIGIRKAMGAKWRDILFQFVTEATLLSLGGGIVGAIAGVGLSRALDGRTVGGQTFQTAVTGDITVLAMAVAIAVGLFFGIYPAARAANLHPIEALRYE